MSKLHPPKKPGLRVFQQTIVTRRMLLTSSVIGFEVVADGCSPCLSTCLERLDILGFCVYFTVTHFCLSVGADDLKVPGGHEETVHLLWGGLVEQCGQEHP